METEDLGQINTELAALRSENAQLKAENSRLKQDLELEKAKTEVLEREIDNPTTEGTFQLQGNTYQFQHQSFIHKGKSYTMETALSDEKVLSELIKTNIVKAI